ncbi:winged helix-turn-helix domain-containing protein [Paraburkholderia fungorum]|uniref:DNA-binding response regulator n=1 Tax=Paraburkholderia fungorum TaxID=134537 RepID=A0A420FT68_9BURK|nr:winged helix-turn-helix domain-containing protein [Paraburkholderia fungorum]RKF36166.1 hypothetical protein BCY88_36850 [Paraburkholderia fungorum]
MSGRIVLVEKNLESAEVLWTNAIRCGFRPELASNLDAGLTMLASDPLPDALILACGNNKPGYRSFLKALRLAVRTRHLAVIVIAPAGDEDDCIDTLTAGADDYVTTPFSAVELFARVKAILRPRPTSTPEPFLVLGELSLDPNTHRVFVLDSDKRTDLYLSPTEFKLLHLLIKHAGEVLSREIIVKSVWGEKDSVTPRIVDVHLCRIRAVLRQARCSYPIETVPRVGYRISR